MLHPARKKHRQCGYEFCFFRCPLLLYCHLLIHAEIYIYMLDTYRRRKTSLTKYMYHSLYCKGSSRVTQVLCVRGSWRPNINCNILTPKLMAVNIVSFSFSRAAQPEAQRLNLLGAGFLYCILSASSLDPNSSGPQAPSAWCGFPYHTSSPTLWNSASSSNSTELYNGSTPTRSLKSNV